MMKMEEMYMKSITKRKLSMAEINVLVQKSFGNRNEVKSISEFEDGWFNAIYLCTLKDGREVILKISPSSEVKVLRYEKNIMKAEVEVLKLLKKGGNIPVPWVYCYDASRTIIDNEYFFMEKINGEPYNKIKESLSEKERETIEIELGMYNKKINSIVGEHFGYFAQEDKKTDNWSEAFYIMIKDILMDGKEYDIKLPLSYDEIDELILKRLKVLEEVDEPRLVHWDIHDGNVFINSEGKISGIIDCERALWGDPLMEFYFSNLINSSYFNNGYGESMLDTKEKVCRRHMYNMYLYLIMVIECKYREYDNAEQEQWSYNMLEAEINAIKSIDI
jgi:aminoglycoside phosphotransferase (APT) family kinase protein